VPEHTRSQPKPSVAEIEIDSISLEVKQRINSALAQVLTPMGVRFKFSIQAYQSDSQRKYPGTTPKVSSFKPLEHRLRVLCYSQKSLEYQLLAEPLAKKLRSLNLQGFHDAIVQFDRSGSQVGELRLRLNLTPSGIVFENWARWGDVQSIAKLLNLALADEEMQVSIALRNLTLHIFCTLDKPRTLKTALRLSATFPSRKTALDIITPLLTKLSPQGIQGATIYGVKTPPDSREAVEESPIWTHWLDLPGMSNPRFSPTSLILAERGNKHAIKFVLERFLNPDLDQYCATGGISLSLLRRNHVLNIMSEAPICPLQSQIAPSVVKILRQFALPNIRGVRVYGRISGQSKPQWTYGVDFASLPLELPPVASPPKSVVQPVVTKIGVVEQIREYLLLTNIWKSQLQSVKVAQLSTIPKFRWEPSLLLLGMGLVLAVASDWLLAAGLGKTLVTGQTASTVVTSPLSFNNPLLEEKLAQYRSICAKQGAPDVLIVGSSRALRGVDPAVLQRSLGERGYADLKVYNFGINGATARTVDLLLRQILTVKQLPKLVIWADGARAFNSGRIDRTYDNIISSNRYRQSILMSGGNNNNQSPLFQIQTAVKSSYEAIDTATTSGFSQVSPVYHHREKMKSWLQSQLPIMGNLDKGISKSNLDNDPNRNWKHNPDGFLPIEVKFDPNTYYQHYTKVTGSGDGDYANFQLAGSQHQALQQVVDLLADRKIPLVFVNLPLTDIYLDKYRQTHETAFKQYMQESANLKRLTFVDLDVSLNTRYDLFSDPSHLNQFGATEVSSQLTKISSIPWGK
jgi:Protein of unknown function (DUF1574)